ncbi:bifunctional 2-polyprenyl-6-hydroxyphenol methylase/3-demethylubiquinol 3-O-methyltransferase UbiG [Prevotella sp. HUN102]|uniref:class I SAM-dependent methyltransferase n=1 Tax=Prevotella sp. HUN102 TaxID=1392486 RepID=UPI00049085E3|nr:class I SAM-dependent methyltransferase [Prevotella sp. HUN102]
MILPTDKDPMGKAISDYYETGKAKQLTILSTMFDDDEMPVAHLFRTEAQMNKMERMALRLAKGKVLDVGAGSGCHTLPLQKRGIDVTAIDISPLSVATQKRRGVAKALLADFFEDDFGSSFDTILMLMNGLGICGKVANLPEMFKRWTELLAPEGCVIADSSDLCYIYEEEEGIIDLTGVEGYYGEVDFQMQYGSVLGNRFDWLYVDFDTLSTMASSYGFKCEMLREGDNNDYLVKITRK